jgi:hypothetical protein
MPFAGRRKLWLERFLFQGMTAATAQEMSKSNPTEGYSTEYDGSFRVRDFVPSMNNISQDSEVSLVRIIECVTWSSNPVR